MLKEHRWVAASIWKYRPINRLCRQTISFSEDSMKRNSQKDDEKEASFKADFISTTEKPIRVQELNKAQWCRVLIQRNKNVSMRF